MSIHINTHIETALKDGIFTKLLIFISGQASKLSTVVFFPIAFMTSLFVMNKQEIQNSEKLKEFTRYNTEEFGLLLSENTMEAISKKFNIIMQQVGFREFAFGFWWLGLILILATIITLATHIVESLTRRFCVSFLAFNDFTKALSTKYIATNEKLKWLMISAVVGIPVALVTAYIKGLFSL